MSHTNVLSQPGSSCVKKFLTVNPKDRLGCGKVRRPTRALHTVLACPAQVGVQNIRAHKFYKSIDWDKLLRKELNAPHDPFVNYEEDTSNFDEYPDSKEPPQPLNLGPSDPDPFADFHEEAHR